MKIQKSAALLGSVVALLVTQYAVAQTSAHESAIRSGTASSTPSDNSKSNKVDPSNMRMTADEQKNDSTDLGLTQRIRESVMADKGLSTYAHNIKIVAVDGTVTLNGVVRNAEAKARISVIAAEVAGKDRVVNKLKVAPPKH